MSVNILSDITYPKGSASSNGGAINCRAYDYYVDGNIFGASGGNLVNYLVPDISGATGISGGNDVYKISNADGSIYVSCTGTTGAANSNLLISLNPGQTSDILYFNPINNVASYGSLLQYPLAFSVVPIIVMSSGSLQTLQIPANTFTAVGQSCSFKSWGNTLTNSSGPTANFSFALAGFLFTASNISIGNVNGNYSLDASVIVATLVGTSATFVIDFVFTYSQGGAPATSYVGNAILGSSINTATTISIGSYVQITGTSTWDNVISKCWFN
jgi:hypothetical protein